MTDYTVQEVLQFVEENDVKFIRLAFCDLFGTLKNIAIMKEELPRAFASGISFDASAIKGFMNVTESDLFLFPDPGTLSILPWRPQQGRVVRMFCDIRHPDGQSFAGDGRQYLKEVVERARQRELVCKVGPECEFYLFEADENGQPTRIPHDRAGYLDVAPLDKGENVRREICLTLEEMDIQPESSLHEQGPGQNEIDFRYSDALTAADQLVTFRSVVKAVASRNGLYASFLPKPLEGQPGSGLHINMSLSHDGVNLFKKREEGHSQIAESFLAGVLDHVREMTAFLNPLVNSYSRLGQHEAPGYITWSHQNRSQLIRIPAAKGAYTRMEVRSPDPSCNPYFAIGLLLEAGLTGIEEQRKLPPATDMNLFTASPEAVRGIPRLPQSLIEAVEVAQNSAFLERVLPQQALRRYLEERLLDWRLYNSQQRDEIEQRLFETV